jgi:hypothetical protein
MLLVLLEVIQGCVEVIAHADKGAAHTTGLWLRLSGRVGGVFFEQEVDEVKGFRPCRQGEAVELLLHPGGTGGGHLKVVHMRMISGNRRNVKASGQERGKGVSL